MKKITKTELVRQRIESEIKTSDRIGNGWHIILNVPAYIVNKVLQEYVDKGILRWNGLVHEVVK